MEIRRFFVTPSDICGSVVTLRGDEFLHMTKVLRYREDYLAYILANDGVERLCRVDRISSDSATLSVVEMKRVDRREHSVTLYAGLLKNNKLDFAIQKAVELGIDRVVPFVSANCAEDKFSLDRAKRIALEAAKQCGSAYLSDIEALMSLEDVSKQLNNFDSSIVAYEGEKKRKIADLNMGGAIALIVGPEGGFREEEIDMLCKAGAVPVTLGRRILRAETASIVASALLLDSLGELDNE